MQTDNHECRIQKLEQNDAIMGIKIENLVETMDNLLGWIKILVVSMIPAIGFLFYQVFKK